MYQLLKRQQLHHLHLHHLSDDLSGLTGRTDTPDSWRKRYNALHETVKDDRGGDLSNEAIL